MGYGWEEEGRERVEGGREEGRKGGDGGMGGGRERARKGAMRRCGRATPLPHTSDLQDRSVLRHREWREKHLREVLLEAGGGGHEHVRALCEERFLRGDGLRGAQFRGKHRQWRESNGRIFHGDHLIRCQGNDGDERSEMRQGCEDLPSLDRISLRPEKRARSKEFANYLADLLDEFTCWHKNYCARAFAFYCSFCRFQDFGR